MRTIPHQPTIHPAILSSFIAEGLTRQEALKQPRRAEVILRHDPFATSPYIVTLSSPSFAFDASGTPTHRDHTWDFATFNEARAWFDELFDANADLILARQQPPKREREDTSVPWKVGDAATLSRLIPYNIWLVRTQSRLDKAGGNSQPPLLSKRRGCENPLEKKRSYGRCSRNAASKHRGALPFPTPRGHHTMVTRLFVFDMASKCESFFSFGNC
jgi:hypothetical protein